jgi:hypothetical protein
MMANTKPVAKSTQRTAKSPARRKAAKRELIDTGRDKRFVRRDEQGQFKESDDAGKSLVQDRRQTAKSTTESGQGDKGDQKRSRKSS